MTPRDEVLIFEARCGTEVRWSSYLLVGGEVSYQRHFDLCPGRGLQSLQEVYRNLGGRMRLRPLIVVGGPN